MCLLWLPLAVACAGDLDDPERFGRDGAVAAGDGDGDNTAGDGDGDASPPPACVSDLFEASCNSIACHGAGATVLDLVSPGVAARVVDVDAAAGGACDGEVVVSTSGGTNLLLDKLQETPSCGLRMPYGAEPLVQSEVDCLTDWVESLGGTVNP